MLSPNNMGLDTSVDSVSDPPKTKLSRIAIDEAVKLNKNWSWIYAAIGLISRLVLDIAVSGRGGPETMNCLPLEWH